MIDALTAWLDSLPDTARSDSEIRLRRLANFTHQRRARFLFGAGMSFKSGMPLAKRLSEKLLAEMFVAEGEIEPHLTSAYPVDAIAEAYINRFDEASLFSIINRTYGRDSELHSGHAALQYLADQGFLERVYTTNFDTLLERGFNARGVTITDSNLDTLAEAEEENRVPVLHLHGAVNLSPKIIESEMFELDSPLGRLLVADMTMYWFAWIGYSMSDGDIRHLFFATRRALKLQRSGKSPFVIYPLTSNNPELEWRVADQLWRARGCAFIPGAAEVVLPALTDLVRLARVDAAVTRILVKIGRDPENPDERRNLFQKAGKVVDDGMGTLEEAVEIIAEQFGADS